jgi:hypothetical protein
MGQPVKTRLDVDAQKSLADSMLGPRTKPMDSYYASEVSEVAKKVLSDLEKRLPVDKKDIPLFVLDAAEAVLSVLAERLREFERAPADTMVSFATETFNGVARTELLLEWIAAKERINPRKQIAGGETDEYADYMRKNTLPALRRLAGRISLFLPKPNISNFHPATEWIELKDDVHRGHEAVMLFHDYTVRMISFYSKK